jgi:acetolactate decarboxylase
MSKLILWSQVKFKFIITLVIATMFMIGCERQNQPEVMVHGELKKIMHGGAREGIVNLTDVLENEHLYGLGAMENLDGEIIIMDSEILISRAELGNVPDIQLDVTDNEKALLLVTSEVLSWKETVVEKSTKSGSIDEVIKTHANELGIDSNKPFPFIIEGDFESMNWHIISSPDPGGSHDDHLKQSWKRADENIKGKILGFYSEHHKAIFTHHTTFTHMHIVYENENLSGHVDEMVLKKNWKLKVPQFK